MSSSGQFYGVALNDRLELESLGEAFGQKPYLAPPRAPVVYMKPGCALARGPIPVPRGQAVVVAATLALLFSRNASHCDPVDAMSTVGAIALALDVSLPQANYYRPAVPQTIRESFLALGSWVPVTTVQTITTDVAGGPSHSWQLDRLDREPARLISDLSQFMTLRAGDVLLVGLPGDAPHVSGTLDLSVTAAEMAALNVTLVEEQS